MAVTAMLYEFTVIVTLDCFDLAELVHRHNTSCMRYRAKEAPPIEHLAEALQSLGVSKPGSYRVRINDANTIVLLGHE